MDLASRPYTAIKTKEAPNRERTQRDSLTTMTPVPKDGRSVRGLGEDALKEAFKAFVLGGGGASVSNRV